MFMKKSLVKQLIEKAEYNCSGENVSYNIDNILALSEKGAYLVFASSAYCKTSFGEGLLDVDSFASHSFAFLVSFICM